MRTRIGTINGVERFGSGGLAANQGKYHPKPSQSLPGATMELLSFQKSGVIWVISDYCSVLVPSAARMAASILVAASSCIPGRTWLYVSMVMPMLECKFACNIAPLMGVFRVQF